MKKAIWVVNIDNYLPELCKITLPTIKNYAKKIGADFNLITERKFSDFPPTYEKLQVHELGKSYDWNILIDADMLIHRDMYDPTEHVFLFSVGFWMEYQADLLFEADQYFIRDGRKLGMASNFMVVSKFCHDVWTPLELDAKTALTKTKRAFIIDEYCISRNIAKFGLRYMSILNNPEDGNLFYHLNVNTDNVPNCVNLAKDILEKWKS